MTAMAMVVLGDVTLQKIGVCQTEPSGGGGSGERAISDAPVIEAEHTGEGSRVNVLRLNPAEGILSQHFPKGVAHAVLSATPSRKSARMVINTSLTPAANAWCHGDESLWMRRGQITMLIFTWSASGQ